MGRWKDASIYKGELMTRFFVDNKEIAPPMDISSLSQILKQVESTHLPANSVVRKIHIDGLPFAPDGFAGESAGNLNTIASKNTVEIFTGTLGEIAQESVGEALAYLDRIEAAIPSLAEGFRFCPSSESFENLRHLCEGFYWLNMLIDRLDASFRMQLETILIRGIPAPQHHQNFISVLKQLIESQEAGDLVVVSDLLEYEIAPMVAVWREMLGAIEAKMKRMQ
jgi:hypothetical protein